MMHKHIRLPGFEIKAIQDCFKAYFPPTDTLWLFGSRVDPRQKGGDIDLFVETQIQDVEVLFEAKDHFLRDLQRRIGEQKIDLAVQFKNYDLLIYRIAKQQGVKLVLNETELLEAKLEVEIKVCDTHVRRIQEALEHTAATFPVTPQTFDDLHFPILNCMDTLVYRFASLQDHISEKIFPSFLELQGESVARKTFIDVLNLLEKKEIIPSRAFWEDLRKTRNMLTHEYPENSEAMAKALNDSIEKIKALMSYWEQLKGMIQTRLSDNVLLSH